MSDLTAVSLFAGVGGIDLALERAGVTVTAAVEIDAAARGVLADQFPKTTLFPDVTEVTGDQLRATGFVPERGIVCAGWPCQGNSVAGRRGGMADPRSGLWRHVVRLLGETRPRWFIGENVPGLLSVNGGDDIAVVRSDLAQLGYWWAERVLDAQHFGVPQRRRRVVLVGHLGDPAGPVSVLLEPEGRTGNPAPRVSPWPDAAGAAGYGLGIAGEPGGVANTLTARDAKGPVPEKSLGTVVVSTPASGGGALGDTGSTPRPQRVGICSSRRVVAALTSSGVGTCGPDDNQAQAGHLIATHTHTFQKVIRSGERDVNGDLPPEVWAEREVAATLNLHDLGSDTRAVELVVQPLAIRGRDDGANLEIGPEGGPYNALRAGDGGSSRQSLIAETVRTHPRPGSNSNGGTVVDETTVRRLTPMECERLQGFPDGHTLTSNGKPQADSARYKQMGNAVAVPVFEWVARRIVAFEDGAL